MLKRKSLRLVENQGMVNAGFRVDPGPKHGRAASKNCKGCLLAKVINSTNCTNTNHQQNKTISSWPQDWKLVPDWASKEQYPGNEIRWV